MSETTIGKLNVSIGITVDYPTAEICLILLEKYLDANEEERLCINRDESGNWDLSIKHR